MEDRWKELEQAVESEVEAVERGKENRFAKGVVTGILSTVCVFLVLGAAGAFWLQGRFSVGSAGRGASVDIMSGAVRAKVSELASMIQQNYYEDVDQEALAEGMYKGLFESLDDPYSAYYTEEEYQEMMISASAQYYGIGAVLQQDQESMQVKIVRVYAGTPSQKAGLKAGDIVVKVEDIDARTMELSELVTHIRGEENSRVHLVISRKGDEGFLKFSVKRAKVEVPTIDGRMLEDDIGYIAIAEFGKATAKDFEQKAEELQAQGMKKMIVDLRDNPGGMMESVTEILDYILPEGIIVYTEDKYGKRQEIRSDAKRYMDLPMAVLINGSSASCSEIFAGAVRDYDYGVLIGTTTFGKGVVQTISPLADKSAIKLTTAKYFTPKGENIHGTGIKPDIKLEYKYKGEKDKKYDYKKDNQVCRAVKELKKN